MNGLIFNNSEFGELDLFIDDGKIYFPASKCASILGYNSPKDAILRHCKGALKRRLPTNGGMQDVKYIPEGDLYRLIIASKLPKAEKFERWVFDEVLPAIRKTGSYSMQKKSDSYTIDDPAARARRWAEEYEERKALEMQIEQDKPKVEFANHVHDTSDLIDIGAFSKLLQHKGLKIGQKRLFKWLRNNHYLRDNNEPYQIYMTNGYFETREYSYVYNGESHIQIKTYITGKGQRYLFKKLAKFYGISEVEK